MTGIDVWCVCPANRGGWKVLQHGAGDPASHHDTQAEALEAAQLHAQREARSLVRIQDEQHRVVDEIFYGDGV